LRQAELTPKQNVSQRPHRLRRVAREAQVLGRLPIGVSTQDLCLPGNSPQTMGALAHILLGSELSLAQKFRQAIPHWEAALKEDPGNPALCCELGHSYVGAYRYSDGMSTFEAGLKKPSSKRMQQVLQSYLNFAQHDLASVGDGHPVPVYIVGQPPKKPPASSGPIKP